MKPSRGWAWLLALATGVAAASSVGGQHARRTHVTPVQKVVELLTTMLEKGKKEKHAEQVQFVAYKQFCDSTLREKSAAVSDAASRMDVLSANAKKAAADSVQLTKEIAEHDDDLATWAGDLKAAAQVRDMEHSDYEVTHKDYSESIDALQRAIVILKKQATDRAQLKGAALLQVSALTTIQMIPEEAQRVISAFLSTQTAESFGFAGASSNEERLDASQTSDLGSSSADAPEALGYTAHSSGIVQMLSSLEAKFAAERTALEKDEKQRRHAHEMLVAEMTSQISLTTRDRDQKAATKASKIQAQASAEGELADVSAAHDADQQYVASLTATCSKKAAAFESRQQLRADELQAVQKAIDIMSGHSVANLMQKPKPQQLTKTSVKGGHTGAALAQLRSSSSAASPQVDLAGFLQSRAEKLGSSTLMAVAQKAANNPFGKVKKMLQELIVRLLDEANEEATHKGWCDSELAANEQTRRQKTAMVETLKAEIDGLQSSVAKLASEIAELSSAISTLDAAVVKATSLRQSEQAKNKEAIKDGTDAQAAVAQALTVLKDFYSKAGQATALLQQSGAFVGNSDDEVFAKPYKGMGGESSGVIGLLEVIESDFARLVANTKTAEATSQREYEAFVSDSRADKKAKSSDIEHLTAKKQDHLQALTEKTRDLGNTQEELDAAVTYFNKLQPSCLESGESYQDRATRRKQEIESLEDALKMLAGGL